MENGERSQFYQQENKLVMKKDLSRRTSIGTVVYVNGKKNNEDGSIVKSTNGHAFDCFSIKPEVELLRQTSTQFSEDVHKRKLVLHFDVRNTILVADSKWSVNVEQALNVYLSGVTWGLETENGGWEWVCDEPCLTSPVPKAITYYRHIERKTVRSPNDRALLRKLTGSFTQEAVGQRFLPHFRSLLKLLEWPHGVKDELLTMYGADGSLYHYLIPAFLRLIELFSLRKRKFAIIIRTYGLDAPQVLKAIDSTAKGNHPSFPDCINVQINKRPGKVTRDAKSRIQFERTIGEDSLVPKSEIYGTEKAIYKMLSTSEGISAFVDHFQHWEDNNFNYEAAKPFWIDEHDLDPDVQHIFFDDNLRILEEDSIVDARTFDDSTKFSGRSMTLEKAMKYEDACLVQANLLESIENVDYFLQKIDSCEAKFEAILKERRQEHSRSQQKPP